MEKEYQTVLGSAVTPGGASAKTVAEAEQDLGVVFPISYRRFLEKYGAAMGHGFEIAGVFTASDDEPPMWKNIVVVTNQMRRVMGSNFPYTFLPISSDGASLKYYLDTSDKEQSLVFAYGPGVEGEAVAKSFEEFVVKLSNGELSV